MTHLLEAYSERAQRAMQGGDVGSSAAGEFPKFTAVRTRDGEPTHVLVKFSGSDNSAGTQRWSDLLVCEHLAAQTLATMSGLTAAQTSILRGDNRTFLGATKLLERKLIDRDTARAITQLWHFGQLIGG